MQKWIKIREYEQGCLDWTFEMQIAIAGLTEVQENMLNVNIWENRLSVQAGCG